MPLKGNLSSFSLEEIFNFIITSKKSGRLVLTREDEESSIFFEKGDVVNSSHKNFRGLDAFIKIIALFETEDFFFNENELAEQRLINESTEKIITRVSNLRNEWKKINKGLPSLNDRLEIVSSSKSDVSISPQEWEILSKAPTKPTLRHLLDGQDEFFIKKNLYSLIEKGLIKIKEGVKKEELAVELSIIKGFTRDNNVVDIDKEIVKKWKDLEVYSGKVLIKDHIFYVDEKPNLRKAIIISAASAKEFNIKEGEIVKVIPI